MIGKEDLIKYATNVHARTYEAVERLRDEDVDWRPAPGEFSVGELVTHIANTRLMNLGGIQTGEIHYRGHAVKPGTDALALRRLVLRTGKKVIAGLVDADLEKYIPQTIGEPFPAWRRVMGGLIEHETHHRSQLCEYLRQLGLEPPPLFGLHAEQLPR
ncbi:DinB family protein [Candidatus Amarobacter glycogenicus]|uniref:DinB family protein n=1 Tax=Candidatus Amarobacter glycogenicus TaxID=3140699 RepID=UPI0031350EC7|nr:DinB family protein [Dehalococcoidia bacterium]